MNQSTILNLLLALGSTAEEVAQNLTAQGYRGKKRNCTSCPVALYLDAHGVPFVEVDIQEDKACFLLVKFFNETTKEREKLRFHLSQHPELQGVYDFISYFDQGKFPGLAR